MRTVKMFWRDMCLGTFRHGARFLIIPLVVALMSAGFAEYQPRFDVRDSDFVVYAPHRTGISDRVLSV